MLTKTADKMTRHLINNGIIRSPDYDIYRYGFETFFAMSANAITALIIGFTLRMPFEAILFLAAFIPLRSYIGGFHSKNHVRCFCLSAAAVVTVLFAANFVLSQYNVPAIIVIAGVCAIIMFFLVPVEDKNHPLDKFEKRVFARRARTIIVIELIALTISMAIGLRVVAVIIFCTLFLAFISSCAGVLKNFINSTFSK